MKNHKTEKQAKKNHIHEVAPDIKVEIPSKEIQNSSGAGTPASLDQPESLLPLESARIVTVGEKKRRITSEMKFIHLKPESKGMQSFTPSVKKIKNLVYRSKVERRISEEKSRLAALEQTMMFERERRFNKMDCIKKMQRTSSPIISKEHGKKKFKRTDQKKGEENKKFKRVKEQVEEVPDDKKMIHAKLVKKMRQQMEEQSISRIPEQNSEMNESNLLDEVNVFDESLKESEMLLENTSKEEDKKQQTEPKKKDLQ